MYYTQQAAGFILFSPSYSCPYTHTHTLNCYRKDNKCTCIDDVVHVHVHVINKKERVLVTIEYFQFSFPLPPLSPNANTLLEFLKCVTGDTPWHAYTCTCTYSP